MMLMIAMQGRMLAAWDMYRAGDLSATGLLKKASTIYQQRLMRTLSETGHSFIKLFWIKLMYKLGLRILAKVAIRYVSRYMPRD